MSGDWGRARERALARLREHAERGLVDSDIKDFLLTVNERYPCIFTTSSCSGRIAVLEGESLFDKRGATIVAQTHDPAECPAVGLQALRAPLREGTVRWLSLQPPILHIVAQTLDTAEAIARLAEQAGFNRACYRRYRAGGFHVEVSASDKLTVLSPSEAAVEWACRALARYKERLRRLEELLLSADLCGAQSAATPSRA